MDKWIEIDLKAVRHNICRIKEKLGDRVLFMAVVKANAYGHGAVEISRLAAKEGASSLGVIGIEEALCLRKSGICVPIALLGPTQASNAGEIVRNRIIPTVDSMNFLKSLDKAASRLTGYPYYLDMDFGLRRWGIDPRDTEPFLAGAGRFRHVRLSGVSTHLDYVPGKNAVEVEEKLPLFERCAQVARRIYPDAIRHAANSSIFRDFPHWRLDMVRIGNLIYGIHPAAAYGKSTGDKLVGFKNPWKFYARIVSIKTVSRGASVGYASEYVAPRKMKIAAVPVGYSDGMTMNPSQRFIGLGGTFHYWGMIRGYQAPFMGRCGISHTLLDVTRIPSVKAGETVLLPVRRTAASPRIPRIYKK